jgi:hypothetical protein
LIVKSPVVVFAPESIWTDIPYPELTIWMFGSVAEPDAAAVHQRPVPLMSKVPILARPEPYWRMVVGAASRTIWPLEL